jgi:hypothetical protein
MLLTLLSIRIARTVAVDSVSQPYQAAANSAYQIIFHQLVINTTTIMLLGIIIAVGAWLSGQSSAAVSARHRFSLLFAGRLHSSVFSKENKLTIWFGRHKRPLQWLALIIVGLLMLIVKLTPLAVLGYSLLWLLLVLAIEFLSSSDTKATKR